MALVIMFGVSLLILIVLSIGKKWEISSGNKNFITSTIARLDPMASEVYSTVEFRWRQVTQTIKYVFFIVIPHKSEESFRQAKHATIREYKKQKEILMGKKDLNAAGGASFFLKRIKEGQVNGKSGKIQDSLS